MDATYRLSLAYPSGAPSTGQRSTTYLLAAIAADRCTTYGDLAVSTTPEFRIWHTSFVISVGGGWSWLGVDSFAE